MWVLSSLFWLTGDADSGTRRLTQLRIKVRTNENDAMTNAPLRLTGNPEADQLLTDDDNALLIGMVLDQQVPMEKAFSGRW
jgi:hypothetical protein